MDRKEQHGTFPRILRKLLTENRENEMPLAIIDVAVIGFFGFLSLATVAHNAGLKNHTLGTLAGFGMLPRWTFFAPVPATSNFYLMYRDIYAHGGGTNWRMLHNMDRPRSRFSFAWNPEGRLRKALHDLITSFSYDSVRMRPELAKLSRPYLLVLHYISSLPRLPGPVATQFIIMEDRRGKRARVIFLSEVHRL